ncbi:hypothetical protein D3C75_1095790 [compost metagenome]
MVQHIPQGFRIVHGTVVILQGNLEPVGQGIQPVVLQVGQKQPGHLQRIQHGIINGRLTQRFQIGLDKADIEPGVMGNQHRVPHKLPEFRQHILQLGCAPDHIIVDVGQLLDVVRNPFMGINEGGEPVDDLFVPHFDPGQLDDLVVDNR